MMSKYNSGKGVSVLRLLSEAKALSVTVRPEADGVWTRKHIRRRIAQVCGDEQNCRENCWSPSSAAVPDFQLVAGAPRHGLPVNLVKLHGFGNAAQLRWAAWDESKPIRVAELDDVP
jgi:hypothetical protein